MLHCSFNEKKFYQNINYSIKFNHLSFSSFVVSVDSMIPFGEISVPQQKRKVVKYLAIIEFGFRRIRRILQNKEGVIKRDRRPRWIIPSEICRVLHILRKPNSINCFIIHSKYFPVLKGVSPFRSLFFSLTKNNIISSPGFLGQRFNNFDVIDSIWRRFSPNLVNSSRLW